jgi:tetratricopeptide (TPR) repeat protein
VSIAADPAARLERRLGFLAADPHNLPLLADCLDLAVELGGAGDAGTLVERALDVLQPLIAARHDAPELRCNLGYALMLAGRHAGAKALLEAVALPAAALLRIRAHHHLGEVDQAIKLAEDFAAAHPEDAEVSGQLAMLYLDGDDFTRARAWAEKAIALPRKTPEAYATAGLIALGDEDAVLAQQLLDKAIELDPRSGRAWQGKGLAALFAGDLAAAEQALGRATQHMTSHVETWHVLAWCQILRGNLDAAEASFRKSYELDRMFAETHGGLAVVEILRGADDRAQRRCDTALKLDPGSFSGQYAKVLLEAKADPGRALRGGALVDLMARPAGLPAVDASQLASGKDRPQGVP